MDIAADLHVHRSSREWRDDLQAIPAGKPVM
jgi:hypothetical protein